jgi:hypothetical protein
VTPPAAANNAPALFRGERHGPLVPQRSTNVRVDREDLAFDIPDDLFAARVTAAYRMTAVAAEHTDVGFAFVRALGGPRNLQNVTASVELDGAPLDFEVATDGEILEPRLRAWLAAHPELETKLHAAAAEASSTPDPDRALREAGGPCAGGCRALLAWSQMVGAHDPGLSMRREFALDAAREVIPEAVAELSRGWSTLPEGRRLVFLLFRLDFAAGQTREVTVRYEHRPTVDRLSRVREIETFEYLLSPAQRWAAFGPLDITVRVPAEVICSSKLPFRREGAAFHAAFPALPEGDLTFSVMPTHGLWLGLERHGAYWAILVAAVGLATILAGAAAGLLSVRRLAWQRALLALFVAGPLAAIAALSVLRPLVAALPRNALGFDDGYDRPSADFLVPLGGLAGAAAAFTVTAVRRRRAPPPPAPG